MEKNEDIKQDISDLFVCIFLLLLHHMVSETLFYLYFYFFSSLFLKVSLVH